MRCRYVRVDLGRRDEMVNISYDYFGANTVVLHTIQIMINVENVALAV